MDTLSYDQLRARGTRKWTVYPEDVLPAFIAESDFPTAPAVKDRLRRAVEDETFGYTPGSSDLQQSLSDFYADRFGWRPRPELIDWVPDVVRGLTLAVEHLTRPGSAVVVPQPAYPPFLSIPQAAGREKINLDANGGLDLAELEEAFEKGAGSLLLCSPYNPLGYTFSAEELGDLVELAARHDARLLVDEIHAPLVLDGTHVPAASLSKKAAEVCVTVTATSKAWNIAGLKCAQIVFSNEDDHRIWRGLDKVTKDGTGTLGVIAAASCYRDARDFLDEEVEVIRANRDRLVEELPRRVPGLKVARPEATYLAWLDFRDTAIPNNPAAHLLKHGRVALQEGTNFGLGGEGFARLTFGTSPEVLGDLIDRIAEGAAAS